MGPKFYVYISKSVQLAVEPHSIPVIVNDVGGYKPTVIIPPYVAIKESVYCTSFNADDSCMGYF